jgi:hypothetical protein
MIPVIGLDVGGANTNGAVVDAAQSVRIVSAPFEVWREPEAMADVIASVVRRLGLGGAPPGHRAARCVALVHAICVPASGRTCQSITAATVSALRLKTYAAARRLLLEL